MKIPPPSTEERRSIWGAPLFSALAASVALLVLMLWSADGDLIFIFFAGPGFCVACLIFLVAHLIGRKHWQSLAIFLSLLAFLAASAGLLTSESTLRPHLRWLLWSHRFKVQVIAQTNPINGELRHTEWDGWGGAPVGDWTAYVVFDPADSLAGAVGSHESKRFRGIPCDVDRVRRLEKNWYSVELSMNEWWDKCAPTPVANLGCDVRKLRKRQLLGNARRHTTPRLTTLRFVNLGHPATPR